MDDKLLNSNLNYENYDDYIEKIFNIFRLSDKENSVVLSISLKKEKCTTKLKIVNKFGDTKEFSDVIFKVTEEIFETFISSLIKRLNDDENFIINDIVNLDKDEYQTFRLVSKNNDLVTIDGLTKEEANKLNKLFETDEKKEELLINNNGISTSNILILIIIVIIIIFIILLNILK